MYGVQLIVCIEKGNYSNTVFVIVHTPFSFLLLV
jgi:hypothetical protein